MTDECFRVTQTDLNRVTEMAPWSTLTVASAAEMTDFDLACVASKAGVLISLLHWATGILAKASPSLTVSWRRHQGAPARTHAGPSQLLVSEDWVWMGY